MQSGYWVTFLPFTQSPTASSGPFSQVLILPLLGLFWFFGFLVFGVFCLFFCSQHFLGSPLHLPYCFSQRPQPKVNLKVLGTAMAGLVSKSEVQGQR